MRANLDKQKQKSEYVRLVKEKDRIIAEKGELDKSLKKAVIAEKHVCCPVTSVFSSRNS